jgi:hypothetical protein
MKKWSVDEYGKVLDEYGNEFKDVNGCCCYLSGDILKMSLINFKCIICNKRADYTVTLTCNQLPDGYFKEGQRSIDFCEKCLPTKFKKFWNSAL